MAEEVSETLGERTLRRMRERGIPQGFLPPEVSASIQAKGSEMTLADLRGFVEATDSLPPETVVMASAGDEQRDGKWWSLAVRFDPRTEV